MICKKLADYAMESLLTPPLGSCPAQRAHERTRVFITASISAANMTGIVRVRDLSVFGALLEADNLPALGTRLKLRKGDLSATGRVVRRERGQAGVQFERPINPIDWLPNKSRSQLMVDNAFRTIKPLFEGGPPVESAGTSGRSSPSALPSSQTSRDELEGIADMLDALADHMSEDPTIISSYRDKLQVLDIASQKLRKLGRNLPA